MLLVPDLDYLCRKHCLHVNNVNTIKNVRNIKKCKKRKNVNKLAFGPLKSRY